MVENRPRKGVCIASMSADGTKLFTVDRDMCKLWDVGTGRQLGCSQMLWTEFLHITIQGFADRFYATNI